MLVAKGEATAQETPSANAVVRSGAQWCTVMHSAFSAGVVDVFRTGHVREGAEVTGFLVAMTEHGSGMLWRSFAHCSIRLLLTQLHVPELF